MARRRKKTDAATEFAERVESNEIVASRLLRLACLRHLRDLREGPKRGLVWQPEKGLHAVQFFEQFLRLPEESAAGEAILDDAEPATGPSPFKLSPFQVWKTMSLLGWYTEKGYRRFRLCYDEEAKGNGKTPWGSGMMLYLATADGERGAQVYFAAVKLDQAKLAFADAEKMVRASPELDGLIEITVNNMAIRRTASFLRAISSEKRGLDGKRAHGYLIDELHEQPTGIVANKMRASTKGLRNALGIEITNSGVDRESICWHHHEYSRQLLEGTVTNDAWFAVICGLDPCEKCRLEGKIMPADDCESCDSWKTEGPHWRKACPNLGVSLPVQYLRELVREAKDMPSQRAIVKRLNFGIWTDQVTVWIPTEQWAACQSREVSEEKLLKRGCYLGIDGASSKDLFAVAAVFPRPIDSDEDALTVDVGAGAHVEAVAGDATPPDVGELVRSIEIDQRFDVLSYFWLPKVTLEQYVKDDNIPYNQWAAAPQRWLRTTPGSVVDHTAIASFIVDVLAKKFKILGIGLDPAKVTAQATALQAVFGEDLVTEIPQGFRSLSEPSKAFEAMIPARFIRHDGNPVLAHNVANVGKEEDSWGNIRPVKLNQRRRVDGVFAIIDALKVAIRTATARRKKSVYARRGAVVVTAAGVKQLVAPKGEANP